MFKPHVPAIALVAASIPAGAKANDFCTSLQSVIKTAPSNFEAIRGDAGYAGKPKWHSVSVHLPATLDCWVMTVTKGAVYFCAWREKGTDIPPKMSAISAQVKSCVPNARYERTDLGWHKFQTDSVNVAIVDFAGAPILTVGKRLPR